MKTVNEILSKAVQTKGEMKLKSIVAVFDQAIYSKAVEIIWKHGDLFLSIIPRLGAFHTICVLLSVIGKRFGPAGLRDIIIESGVIEEGSVEAVLNGKAYNRAVRFHKLMYEACMRLVWEGFVDWLDNTHSTRRSWLVIRRWPSMHSLDEWPSSSRGCIKSIVMQLQS